MCLPASWHLRIVAGDTSVARVGDFVFVLLVFFLPHSTMHFFRFGCVILADGIAFLC